MKVIFASYNSCCQNASGGVQNRLRKIASLLQEMGIKTELFNPFETKLEKGDILHVFMLSIDTHFLIQYAKRKGIKVVTKKIDAVRKYNNNDFADYRKNISDHIPICLEFENNSNEMWVCQNKMIDDKKHND